MDTFTNYQLNEETWEHLCSVTFENNVETVPTSKQRCQANARERDRTQKDHVKMLDIQKNLEKAVKNYSFTYSFTYLKKGVNHIMSNRIVIKIPISFLSSVNTAFNALRVLIPTEPPDRKLSKIEILRLAGSYITHLDNQLYTGNMEQPCIQKSDREYKNTSLCTFCWSTIKKDKSSATLMSKEFQRPY